MSEFKPADITPHLRAAKAAASDLAADLAAVGRRYGDPARTIRVPDELWDAAKGEAAERGETVSDVVRRALERYVKR